MSHSPRAPHAFLVAGIITRGHKESMRCSWRMAHLIGYLFFVCLFLPSNEVSAWGGPVGMKVPPTCHSARSKESASSFLHRKSRFSGFWSPMDSTGVLKSDFVGRRSDLLRMTRVA